MKKLALSMCRFMSKRFKMALTIIIMKKCHILIMMIGLYLTHLTHFMAMDLRQHIKNVPMSNSRHSKQAMNKKALSMCPFYWSPLGKRRMLSKKVIFMSKAFKKALTMKKCHIRMILSTCHMIRLLTYQFLSINLSKMSRNSA